MYQVNAMVFGRGPTGAARTRLPLSCGVTLALTVLPVILIGLHIPGPLQNLLRLAAAGFGR
jgi:hypothetical protein